MKAITLKNLPPDIADRIQEIADESGLSLNQTVVRLLSESLSQLSKNGPKAIACDLDQFAGLWSKKDGDDFDKSLNSQRTIDLEHWK